MFPSSRCVSLYPCVLKQQCLAFILWCRSLKNAKLLTAVLERYSAFPVFFLFFSSTVTNIIRCDHVWKAPRCIRWVLTKSGYYLYPWSDLADVFVVKHAWSLPHVSASFFFFLLGKVENWSSLQSLPFFPLKFYLKKKSGNHWSWSHASWSQISVLRKIKAPSLFTSIILYVEPPLPIYK